MQDRIDGMNCIRLPPRKKSCEPLRELEKQLERDTDDGIQSFVAAKKTVNDFYEKFPP